MECSLKVAWLLGEHKKPFSDADIVKECMPKVMGTLLEGKQKEEIKDKIKQIPLSDSTMRRTEILSEDLTSQLDNGIKNAPCISLAVDESTDTQLVVYVRFYDEAKRELCEDLLGITNLEARTRGEDIYDAIKAMLTKRATDLKSVVSLTTDGAPSIIESGRELVGPLKEDHPDMLSYHCKIHQSILCASLGKEYAEVTEKLVKLVNFLQATSLQHCLLHGFLTEVNARY
ncbi:SCAN domain-containing protein 3-like 16 [Homarus americanus]|uniref:SCAN domain-containing protein 3-like 16 n=1 Tax=Homarus americanus TaxID=6706 RepID=A0A8J5JUE4_HOMAM|nr:SCAN domain-containing protein 3-like 16 [Homarus americanus]